MKRGNKRDARKKEHRNPNPYPKSKFGGKNTRPTKDKSQKAPCKKKNKKKWLKKKEERGGGKTPLAKKCMMTQKAAKKQQGKKKLAKYRSKWRCDSSVPPRPLGGGLGVVGPPVVLSQKGAWTPRLKKKNHKSEGMYSGRKGEEVWEGKQNQI